MTKTNLLIFKGSRNANLRAIFDKAECVCIFLWSKHKFDSGKRHKDTAQITESREEAILTQSDLDAAEALGWEFNSVSYSQENNALVYSFRWTK